MVGFAIGFTEDVVSQLLDPAVDGISDINFGRAAASGVLGAVGGSAAGIFKVAASLPTAAKVIVRAEALAKGALVGALEASTKGEKTEKGFVKGAAESAGVPVSEAETASEIVRQVINPDTAKISLPPEKSPVKQDKMVFDKDDRCRADKQDNSC